MREIFCSRQDHPRLHALEQFHCVRGDNDCVYAGGTALFKVRDPEVTSLSRLFLISYYLSTAVRDVPHSFFVMTERHRFATGVIIAEAAANLILNLLLLKPFGMRVVIWNGLIIKIIIAAVIILPYLLRCIRIPAGEFLGKIFLQPSIFFLYMAYILVLNRF